MFDRSDRHLSSVGHVPRGGINSCGDLFEGPKTAALQRQPLGGGNSIDHDDHGGRSDKLICFRGVRAMAELCRHGVASK